MLKKQRLKRSPVSSKTQRRTLRSMSLRRRQRWWKRWLNRIRQRLRLRQMTKSPCLRTRSSLPSKSKSHKTNRRAHRWIRVSRLLGRRQVLQNQWMLNLWRYLPKVRCCHLFRNNRHLNTPRRWPRAKSHQWKRLRVGEAQGSPMEIVITHQIMSVKRSKDQSLEKKLTAVKLWYSLSPHR